MRKIVLALAFIIGMTSAAVAADNTAATTAAGNTREVELLNGIYSVEVPANWWVKEDDGNQGVTMSPTQNSPFRLVISSPLPGIEDQAGFAELVVKAIFEQIGGDSKVLAEEVEKQGPETLIRTIFNIRRPQGNIDGMLDTVDLNGYTITMLIIGPDENFNDFLPAAEDIKASYGLDPDKLDENHDALEEIAKATIGQLVQALGPMQDSSLNSGSAVGGAR